jgi:farnesyl diphosphate synthase
MIISMSSEILGNIGTDIQDNKCAWLITEAVQRATLQLRKVLHEQ